MPSFAGSWSLVSLMLAVRNSMLANLVPPERDLGVVFVGSVEEEDPAVRYGDKPVGAEADGVSERADTFCVLQVVAKAPQFTARRPPRFPRKGTRRPR